MPHWREKGVSHPFSSGLSLSPRAVSWLALVLLLQTAGLAQGQSFRGRQTASIVPPLAVKLEPGKVAVVPIEVRIRAGYHINSDKPAEQYLIPTRLTWNVPGLKLRDIAYPEPETVNYAFSEQPLSVFSDTITIKSAFQVPPNVPSSLTELPGQLRYQACNDKACLPPATLDITVPVARP